MKPLQSYIVSDNVVDNKRLHLDLFSTLWEDFWLHLGLPSTFSLTIWKAKAKICSTFAFEFFSNFGHYIGAFNPSFYFHIKNIFFLNRTKIDIFADCPLMELFFWKRNSFFLPECEENVSLNEDTSCHRNFAHIGREMPEWTCRSSYILSTFPK